MDSLQDQVILLTNKIDTLHGIVDQVNLRVAEALNNAPTIGGESEEAGILPATAVSARSGLRRGLETQIDHKDVLLDNTYLELEARSAEHNLSPEVQIQRLTAQLTAAYNRIAALEEQLLATRSH
ncbi:MAG: hypothetical protein AAGF66_12565 [Cyanobacteria bacterium P01_H01_bin.119]